MRVRVSLLGRFIKKSSNSLFHDSAIQIVNDRCPLQGYSVKLARIQRFLAGDADIAVHLGGITCRAAEVEAVLLIDAITEDMDGLAHFLGLLAGP